MNGPVKLPSIKSGLCNSNGRRRFAWFARTVITIGICALIFIIGFALSKGDLQQTTRFRRSLFYKESEKLPPILGLDFVGPNRLSSDVFPKDPHVSIRQLNVHEGFNKLDDLSFYWAASSHEMKGIVFVAGPCKIPCQAWFVKSAECTSCGEYLMQTRITTSLKREGFAVLVMSPQFLSGSSQCWHSDGDQKYVAELIHSVYHSLNTTYSRVPLFALGVENGGIFLGDAFGPLSDNWNIIFSAACFLNSGVINGQLDRFPPTIFADQVNNKGLVTMNNKIVRYLQTINIPALQVLNDPWLIDDNYFEPFMTPEESKTMHAQLLKRGLVRPSTTYTNSTLLIRDPVDPGYLKLMIESARVAAPAQVPMVDSLSNASSPILQLLNLAFGMNEINPTKLPDIMHWYLSHTGHSS